MARARVFRTRESQRKRGRSVSPNVLPWVVYPYLVALVFVCGHIWRWKKDQFTITTRSSRPLERKWLMRGSIPFHLGMLGVISGHVVGLLIPAGLTAKFGVSEHVYHLQAVVLGGAAGIVCWTGILILTGRRLLITPVRRAGSLADIITELMLLVVITLGNCLTLGYQLFVHEYDYRETVSVWVRQLTLFDPDPSSMSAVPWTYQAHILAAFTLLAFWPFTRLVHVWTAPLQYVRRWQTLYRGPRRAPALVPDGQRPSTWCDVVARRVS